LASVVLLCTVGCKKEKEKEASGPANQYTDARDGKTYKTVVIGTQTWMAENMNYAVAGSLCYDNKEEKCAAYGRLYTQEQARTACPQGYRLPSEDDFQKLEKFLGMSDEDAQKTGSKRGTDEGTKLKEGGSSGFNGKLSGYNLVEKFNGENVSTTLWASTESGTPDNYYYRRLVDSLSTITKSSAFYEGNYYCARCIKE
jgi:uncharacterized protein (TIGR02145 family)